MINQYIAKDDTIIFSPEFNEELNHLILVNYKKIIFSDYKLNQKLFDSYSNSNLNVVKCIGSKNFCPKCIHSKFNHPLNSWDVACLKSREKMFERSEFNQHLRSWNT